MLKKTFTLRADGNNIRQVYRLTNTIEYACRISENCLPTTLKLISVQLTYRKLFLATSGLHGNLQTYDTTT